MVEPARVRVDGVPGMHPEHQRTAGRQWPHEGVERCGQLGRREVDERVPRQHRTPAARGRRTHQAAQVADLVVPLRMSGPRGLDHRGRQVDPRRVCAGCSQVCRDLARTAADLDDRPRTGGDPVEQPALEGQLLQLVGHGVGIRLRNRAVRRQDLGITRPRPRREHHLAVDPCPGSPRGRRRQRHLDGPEQVDPAIVLLAGLTWQLDDQRRLGGRHPGKRRFDLGAIGEGVQAFGAGLQSARRLRSAQQQHGHQRALIVRPGHSGCDGLHVLQGAAP